MKFWNKRITTVGMVATVTLAGVGTVLGLNGLFGGEGSVPSDTMTRGLAGYWGMDEGSGTTTADMSGNGNSGRFLAVATSPQWAKAKVASGLQFDGTDDLVNVVDSGASPFDVTDAITISAWINPSGWGSGGGYGHIVSKSSDASITTGYAFYLSQTDGDALKFYANNGGISLFAANAITLNQWQYVTVTYDRKTLKLYVNGVLKGSAAETDALTTDNSALLMGARISGSYHFQGTIDEVRLYSRALSAEEVRYHYNKGGPVGYWKFDEGSGLTAYDSSGNANTGTLQNNMATTSWATGKSGSALSFDGVDDYVNVADSANLDFGATQDFTITAWINISSGSGSRDIITKGGTGNTDQGYWLIVNGGNVIEAGLSDGSGARVYGASSAAVADGKWHYVSATFDRGGKVIIYIDGKADGSIGIASEGDLSNALALNIGRYVKDATEYFPGLIDDVRIYNYARAADEIRLDYNAGLASHFGPQSSCEDDPGSCMTKGLVGYWPMDDGSGTTTADISGSENLGRSLTVATSPQWTKGKIGGALSFDGTDDKVTVPLSSLYISPITAEFWVQLKENKIAGILSFGANTAADRGFQISWDSVSTYWHAFWGTNGGTYDELNSTGIAYSTAWQQVVFTHDGNKASLYVNGVLNNSKITTFPIFAGTDFNDIGTGQRTFWANGLIDEVRVYSRALSAEEVRYHYNKGGPVGYWKFDEGSGLTAYDSSGNANTGTLTGMNAATSWIQGEYGSALLFDGSDDYVDAGNNSSLNFTTQDFSIGWWVKPRSVKNQMPVSRGLYLTDGYYVVMNGSAQVGLTTQIAGTQTQVLSGSNQYVPDSWQHFVVTKSGSVGRIYENGVELPKSTNDALNDPVTGTRSLLMGDYNGGSWKMDGLMDDVRIYNYARSVEQIKQDYNAGLSAHFGPQSSCEDDPGSCMTKGLVGYWPMDDGSGTTTADISGNNNSALFLEASSSPVWTKGRSGSALQFDGTGDYVYALSTAGDDLDITGALTIEFWLKNVVPAANKNILSKDDGASTHFKCFTNTSPAAIGCWSRSGATNQVVTTSFTNDNKWHYIVFTRGADTDLAIYFDGRLEASRGSSANPTSNSDEFYIGSAPATTGFFNGLIDEVRLYNRALSAEEVRYHYNQGAPVFQYKFDEGAGQTIYNYSESSKANLFLGTTGNTTSSNSWVQGRQGSAILFDGVSDYVKSTTTLTAIASSSSYSLWFKSANGTYSGDQYLFTQGTNDPAVFIESTDNKIYVMSEAANVLSSVKTVNDANWHHLEMTVDGASLKLYLDGVLEAKTPYTQFSSAAGNLFVGSNATPGSFFNGIIDDVRIYDYARTPAQVLQDYNQGKGAYFK